MDHTKYYAQNIENARIPYWEEKGLLEGIEDSHIKMTTALMLTNQELMNEMKNELALENSLEIVGKIVPQLLMHKLISVQPKLSPGSIVYHLKNDYTNSEVKTIIAEWPNAAITRKLKECQDGDTPENKAKRIAKELDFEVLTDLWNNAGTVMQFTQDDFDSMYGTMCKMTDTLHRKLMIGDSWPNKKWVVIGEEVADKYPKLISWLKDNSYYYKLYIVKGWNKPGMLIGYKGEEYYVAGYAYCPYIMLSKTPKPTDENLIMRPGILTRFGKVLTNAKFYGRIMF